MVLILQCVHGNITCVPLNSNFRDQLKNPTFGISWEKSNFWAQLGKIQLLGITQFLRNASPSFSVQKSKVRDIHILRMALAYIFKDDCRSYKNMAQIHVV